MDDPSPATAISALRQRLIDDMNMRRFSRETQRNYIRDSAEAAATCVWSVMSSRTGSTRGSSIVAGLRAAA